MSKSMRRSSIGWMRSCVRSTDATNALRVARPAIDGARAQPNDSQIPCSLRSGDDADRARSPPTSPVSSAWECTRLARPTPSRFSPPGAAKRHGRPSDDRGHLARRGRRRSGPQRRGVRELGALQRPWSTTPLRIRRFATAHAASRASTRGTAPSTGSRASPSSAWPSTTSTAGRFPI
jgi:hypothetical protein